MEHGKIDECIEEWETLSFEYQTLENLHSTYKKKLEEVTALQGKCIQAINHQRYRINILKQSLKKHDLSNDSENKEREQLLQTDFIRRYAQLNEMEYVLPKPNGMYLKIILGNINTSILDKNEKFRYKDEYEKFKLVTSLIALGLSFFNLFTNIRTMDLLHMFLLVWYYCTLTIRESILKVNGSRIKGWWRAHHFISTVLSGVLLIWPNGDTYYSFRKQFMAFNVYISVLQYLQFMYQRGCLYRLKALGERHNMDITIEGFHSWMWRGLGFVLPFLFVGYFWELYNAYTLYKLSLTPNSEWHVLTLAFLFLVLFLGNTITTAMIIPEKFQARLNFKYRFTRLDKYIWTHKKRKVSFRTVETPQRRTPSAASLSQTNFILEEKGRKSNEKSNDDDVTFSTTAVATSTSIEDDSVFTPLNAEEEVGGREGEVRKRVQVEGEAGAGVEAVMQEIDEIANGLDFEKIDHCEEEEEEKKEK